MLLSFYFNHLCIKCWLWQIWYYFDRLECSRLTCWYAVPSALVYVPCLSLFFYIICESSGHLLCPEHNQSFKPCVWTSWKKQWWNLVLIICLLAKGMESFSLWKSAYIVIEMCIINSKNLRKLSNSYNQKYREAIWCSKSALWLLCQYLLRRLGFTIMLLKSDAPRKLYVQTSVRKVHS